LRLLIGNIDDKIVLGKEARIELLKTELMNARAELQNESDN